MPSKYIDLEKLRAYLRHFPAVDFVVFVDRALDELSDEGLARVLHDYVGLEEFRQSAPTEVPLLSAVEAFHADALRGTFYEDFDVNSRNYLEMSRGTQYFHATFGRLLRRCLEAERVGQEPELARAFGLLFDLMKRIDGDDRIVFYADESGSWQLCVVWPEVFQRWCPCVAATTTSAEYLAAMRDIIELLPSHRQDELAKIIDYWQPKS